MASTVPPGHRKASSMYEENFQKATHSEPPARLKEPPLNIVKIQNNIYHEEQSNSKTANEWKSVFDTAAFFEGRDIILGELVIMVYEDPDTSKISTVLFSCLGEFHFHSFALDNRSRFFDACKNLDKKFRKSNVRRALAITLLKTYSLLDPAKLKTLFNINVPLEWDETVAGELSSTMAMISTKSPAEIGESLLNMGFFQAHYIESTLLDVVYDDDPSVIDANNRLVFLLGEQLEQLFDPLTEYSPESTDTLYKPPESAPNNQDDRLIQQICDELIQLQENTTTQLVKFLREVVIPIRIKTLNNEIRGLTTSKVNQVFPPTIDEVTRVNCIFLDALKKAADFGSLEIIKACGSAIPYFFKATMRHESALKSFGGNMQDFMKIYGQHIHADYTEAAIDVILKSQINLTKIKVILERLVGTKRWAPAERLIVDLCFKSAVETIDSFGKEELKPYNKRVFTPSGKILTELCDNWPPVLSYGWVNRKVITVVDTFNPLNLSKGVIVVFSDYVVFAEVIRQEKTESQVPSPQVSDILMNSLINENPINNIPELQVTSWCHLNNLEVSTFAQHSVSFSYKDGRSAALVLKIDDPSSFIRIYNKALILSKSTPFHLFRIERFGFDIFVTAHERSTYSTETTHSPLALFLNIEKSVDLLLENDVDFGLFAKFVDDDMIRIDTLTASGAHYSNIINSSDFSNFLSEEISNLEKKRHSIDSKRSFNSWCLSNRALLSMAISKPVEQPQPLISRSSNSSTRHSSSRVKVSATTTKSQRKNSNSPVNINKPLPSAVETESPKSSSVGSQKPQKKSSFRKRLSKIFGSNSKKTSASLPEPMRSPVVNSTQFTPLKSANSESFNDFFDPDVPELSNLEDVNSFETSMSPIFDEDLEKERNIEVLGNMPSEFSVSSIETNDVEGEDKVDGSNKNTIQPSSTLNATNAIETSGKPHLRALFGGETHEPANYLALKSDGLPTFGSFDEEFQSPLLKVGVWPQDDVQKDIEAFYTPMSSNTGFENYEGGGGISESLSRFELESFDRDEDVLSHNNTTTQCEKKELTNESISFRTSSFKSCIDEEAFGQQFQDLLNVDDTLDRDDSFRYLAKIVDGSFRIEDLRRSESSQPLPLPRSYSSLKYLASYIDTNFSIVE